MAKKMCAQIQANIIIRGEFAQVCREENVPSLAGGPFKN